jgi:predicted permease
MALVSLVLLIACLNLATLLMARAASREREIATRFALGASRPRLLRQLLTESLLLAAAGTGLGLAVSPLVANLLVTFLTTGQDLLHPPLNVAPDARVFLFTAVVAVIATVLTGLAPALRSTGRELQQRMRDSSSALRGAERRRFWPRVLLACEVALALVLVTGASLLGLSIVKLHQVPLGFDPNNLIFLQLEMNKQPRRGKALVRTYHEIAGALAKIPGVAAVSFLDVTPMEGSRWRDDAAVPGKPAHEMFRNQVGPDYFRAMRTPLFAGREFSWNDTDESGRVVILNEAAARVLFAGASPLGQRVQVGEKQLGEVVGVVANTKYSSLRVPDPPEVYSSITQDVKDPSYTAVLRASGPPSAVIAAAREIVRRVMPDIPPPVAVTMEQTLAQSLATERMMATLALFFGAIALLITGIGLYGTLAYATERRTGEIGIRIALGAQRGDVISMMCAENGAVALGGCIAGILGAMAAARLIASFLYGTSPRNPAVLALSAAALMCIAAAASLIPAIRAARLDPMAAIRHE